MHILFFLHRIGPYHHARFSELSKHCKLTAVEILPWSNEYDWEPIHNVQNYKIIKIQEHLKTTETSGNRLFSIIQNIIINCDPTVIITMGWSNRSYFAALIAGKKYKIPVCVCSDTTYDHVKRYFFVEYLKSYLVKCFDGFLVAGHRSKKYLEMLGIDSSKIFQPFDVVDNKFFQQKNNPAPLKFKKPYILCISRYIPEKNLETLIDAFDTYVKLFPEQKFYLYIVGSGQLKDLLNKKINRIRCNKIQLHPFVQYNELPALYEHASALILPSISEQWGLVVNEAMASGLPVIVSKNCGCVDDLVIDEVNGFRIEPTTSGIIEGLIKINKVSSEQLNLMGQKSRIIIENYDLKDFKLSTFMMIQKASEGYKNLNLLQRLLLYIKIWL